MKNHSMKHRYSASVLWLGLQSEGVQSVAVGGRRSWDEQKKLKLCVSYYVSQTWLLILGIPCIYTRTYQLYFIHIELINGNFQKQGIEILKWRIILNSQYISFMKICIWEHNRIWKMEIIRTTKLVCCCELRGWGWC